MATIEITEAHDYDLVARVVGVKPAARKPREASVAGKNGGPSSAGGGLGVNKPPHSTSGAVVRIATGAPLRVLP